MLVGGGQPVPLAVRRERVEVEVEQLIRLGATVLHNRDDDTSGRYGFTMADPDGSEFCVA